MKDEKCAVGAKRLLNRLFADKDSPGSALCVSQSHGGERIHIIHYVAEASTWQKD